MSIQDDLQTGQKKLVSRYRELILGFLIFAGIVLIGLSFVSSFPVDLRELLRSIGLTVAPSGIVTLFLSRYADFIAEISIKNTIQNQFQASFQQFEAGIKKNVTDQIQTCVNENFESVRTMLDDQKDKIEGRLNTLTPSFSLLSSGTRYGVENIHLNRAQALESFNWFLDSELGKAYKGEPSRIWIVSSSIKGLLTIVTDHFDGKRLFEKIRDSKCDIRQSLSKNASDPEHDNRPEVCIPKEAGDQFPFSGNLRLNQKSFESIAGIGCDGSYGVLNPVSVLYV